jgi:hypothetical protein
MLNAVIVLYSVLLDRKIVECFYSTYGVLKDRKSLNVVRVLCGVLMDRKIVKCCDSTYGVLMGRKIAECYKSTIWCIDG